MGKQKSNGTLLTEPLERITRLLDDLERVQGERRKIAEIAGRIRHEVGADAATRRTKKPRPASGTNPNGTRMDTSPSLPVLAGR